MPKRRSQGRPKEFRTQAPKEGTRIAAAVFRLLGFADYAGRPCLGAFSLRNDLSLWSLDPAGLLLIFASSIDGL